MPVAVKSTTATSSDSEEFSNICLSDSASNASESTGEDTGSSNESASNKELDDDDKNWSYIFTDDNYSTDQEELRSNFSEGDIDSVNDIISENSDSENPAAKHEKYLLKAKEANAAKFATPQKPKLLDDDSVATLKSTGSTLSSPSTSFTIKGSSQEDSFHMPNPFERRHSTPSRTNNELHLREFNLYPPKPLTADHHFKSDEPTDVGNTLLNFISKNLILVLVILAFCVEHSMMRQGVDLFDPSTYPFITTEPFVIPKPSDNSHVDIPEQSGNHLEETTWELMGKLGMSIWNDIENGLRVTEGTAVKYSDEYVRIANSIVESAKGYDWRTALNKDTKLFTDFIKTETDYVIGTAQDMMKRVPNVGWSIKNGFTTARDFLGKKRLDILKSFGDNYELDLKKLTIKAQCALSYSSDAFSKASKVSFNTYQGASDKLEAVSLKIAESLSSALDSARLYSNESVQKFEEQSLPYAKMTFDALSKWNNQACNEAFRLFYSTPSLISNLRSSVRDALRDVHSKFQPVAIYPPVEEIIDSLEIRVDKYIRQRSSGDFADDEVIQYIIAWDTDKIDTLKKDSNVKQMIETYYKDVVLKDPEESEIAELELKRVEFLLSVL